MMKKHIWRSSKGHPDYCERCGKDRTPASEKAACRPTSLL